MNDETTKRGFRLIDLVIGLAVLGAAGAIILPWIQQARYAQDTIKCSGHMRFLALACHSCNDTARCLPPFKAPSDADPKSYFGTPGNHGSVFFFLTPFLEYNTLYSNASVVNKAGQTAYDVDATSGTGKVTRPPQAPFAGQEYINCLRCPIDPTMPVSRQVTADPEGDGVPRAWGASSYACNYLVFGNAKAIERGELASPDRYDPAAKPAHIAPSTCARFPASFPDGTSNTILFAEKLARCQWVMGATAPGQPGGNLWGPAVENAQWAPAFAMESPWHDGTTFQLQPSNTICNVAYPSTGHYDHLTVSMADGSCRCISPKISSQTFYALCTPNGGEVIGPDF